MSVVGLLLILFTLLAIVTIPFYWYKRNTAATPEDPKLYASLYDAIYFDNEKFEQEMQLVDAPKGSYVLDVGCGTGTRVGRAENAVGVDISPNMLAVARKKYPKKTFVQGDVLQKHLFDKETFTSVWCLGDTVCRLPKKMQFLQNAHRWLDNNGTLVLQLDEVFCSSSHFKKNFDYEIRRIGNTCRERMKYKGKKAVVETTFYPTSRERILTMAERVGFVLERTEQQNKFYFFRKSNL